MEQIREETDHRLKLRLLSAALMIFVAPPGFDELQSRLTGRHTEDEETVQKRLAIARQELKQAYHYDYVRFFVQRLPRLFGHRHRRARHFAGALHR